MDIQLLKKIAVEDELKLPSVYVDILCRVYTTATWTAQCRQTAGMGRSYLNYDICQQGLQISHNRYPTRLQQGQTTDCGRSPTMAVNSTLRLFHHVFYFRNHLFIITREYIRVAQCKHHIYIRNVRARISHACTCVFSVRSQWVLQV